MSVELKLRYRDWENLLSLWSLITTLKDKSNAPSRKSSDTNQDHSPTQSDTASNFYQTHTTTKNPQFCLKTIVNWNAIYTP